MGVANFGYQRLAKPMLFRLGGGDAEVAHHRTLAWLASMSGNSGGVTALRLLGRANRAPRTVFGIDFPSVVGLAAGMDKDGVALKAWPALGFGHVEVGTVTSMPQPGNEKPRLFRLRDSGALINRMGFNNAGSLALADKLAGIGPIGVPLGISLGKSKVTPVSEASADYVLSVRRLLPHADYIAVNVSSPNTVGLRSLQDKEPLTELLAALTTEAFDSTVRERAIPVLVKIAPDLTDQAIAEVLQACSDTGVAGVIATNTTLARDGLVARDARAAAEVGGLSGAPLTVRSREVVKFVATHCDLPVIGVGGIMTPADGLSLLDAGASLLQVYTGFIYGGPGLIAGINEAVAAMDKLQLGSPRSQQTLDDK
ncbi:quinone-dependent dihydroorotate dehydrogenase [Nakamurella antarctica]|uniref:Dihydroorotate dehydrogenase (quinone) n=1 Tax=Nakamurella antarctica TaxID=1902245 RepID=A0A3G8ZJC9_9ACTN|nr:quinone-dependent dihydroorotate dehydrogenase [Nakamurella antarctica]AZI57472.1 quinone-dependent dihydroorotate dehydrogenase [Nakamurella antarctica]